MKPASLPSRSIPSLSLLLALSATAACEGPGGGGGGVIAPATCRNGALDPGEICDGALVGNQSCQSAGYERGVLVCNTTCTNFDYSGCSGGSTPGPDTTDTTTSGPDTSAPSDTSAPGDSGPGQDTTSPGNSAPNILSLTPNTSTLDAGDTLVVTAIVTDPDGIDDLIGGNLVDVSSGGSYGAFSTSAAEGSYAIELTWQALGAVRPIDAPASGRPLELRAEFYDVAGAKTQRTLTVTLRCDGDGEVGLCDGECTDLMWDDYACGNCGTVCSASDFVGVDDAFCYYGTCAGELEVDVALFETGSTCKTICDAQGMRCQWPQAHPGGRVESASGGEVLLACDTPYNGAPDLVSGHCLCEQGDGVVEPLPTLTTITSIQTSAASVDCTASGDQAISGDILVEGVVTVARFDVNTTLAGMFVSDGTQAPSSGLFVRFPKTQPWSFTPGTRVRMTGKHHEYYCMTQLAASAITSIGSASVPAPRSIAKTLLPSELEPWESVVVQLGNVDVIGETSFGEATTDASVLIDDFILGASFVLPSAGTNITTLRGALTFGFETYRVSPRTADDY